MVRRPDQGPRVDVEELAPTARPVAVIAHPHGDNAKAAAAASHTGSSRARRRGPGPIGPECDGQGQCRQLDLAPADRGAWFPRRQPAATSPAAAWNREVHFSAHIALYQCIRALW